MHPSPGPNKPEETNITSQINFPLAWFCVENFKEEFPDLADNGRVEVYNICSAVSRLTSTEKVQYYSKLYCWLKTDIQPYRQREGTIKCTAGSRQTYRHREGTVKCTAGSRQTDRYREGTIKCKAV